MASSADAWRRHLAASVSGSVGTHHTASGSVGTHPTVSFIAAVAFYNIGVQNKEINSKNWTKKARRIKKDIDATFSSDHGIQVLLLSEFGNMYERLGTEWTKKNSRTLWPNFS